VLSFGRNRMLPGCISNRAEQLQVENSLSMIYEVIATFVAVVGVFVVYDSHSAPAKTVLPLNAVSSPSPPSAARVSNN
jgi:hypothetical protein